MRFSRRSLIQLGAVATLPMPFISARAATKKSIIIAEPQHNIGYLPMYVAAAQGFFDEEGLDVRVVTMDGNGAAHTNAVLSGQAFAFIGGPEHCAFAKAKGAELRAVANVVDRGNVYFMAKPGLDGPTVTRADMSALGPFFKAHSISTGFFGGTPNSITRYVIARAGLKLDEVKVVESTSAGIIAAVKSGQAETGVDGEPQITQGIRAGAWQEPFINIPKILGPYAYSTLNVRLDSIQKDPAAVQGFVKAVMRGLMMTYADRAAAEKVVQKEFPTMPAEDSKATLDRAFADELWSKDGNITKQGWDTAKEVVMTAGILKQDVPYEAIIDMQFLPRSTASAN
jgi:NitT/TauT family transport system substrate-binding protein